MKKLQFSIAALCGLFLFTSGLWAQRPKPRPRTAPAKPVTATTPTPAPEATPAATPESTPVAPPVNQPPGRPLVKVNGQLVTSADLGPEVNNAVAAEESEVAQVRRDVLDFVINGHLIDAEAAKRKTTREALLNAEVNSKITEPTESEVQAFYEANRAQMQGQPLAAAREQIVNYMKRQQGEKLQDDFIKRLRAAWPVTMGADVNAPNLARDTVLATAAGKTILAGKFNDKAALYVYAYRRRLWEATMSAADLKINDLLLIAEAKKRNTTPDQVLLAEVSQKLAAPTDAEITKFYNDNRARIPRPLEQVRGQISELLMRQQEQNLMQNLVQTLRNGSQIELLYPQPEPPLLAVSVDDDPAQGPADAPVTIVIFTDFQCSSCAQVHPVLEGVISEFGAKVRLVVRDFPLAMHKDARKAAEAANAANAQGKFFDYIHLLYKNQDKQDTVSLKNYAIVLGLDRAKFDAELDSGKYAAEVEKDVQDGLDYSVQGTPTIFVNGLRLGDLSSNAIRDAINQALKKAGKAE